VDPVKQFDIWFGAIFGTVGGIALIVGLGLGLYFVRRPPRQRSTPVFLLLPLTLGLGFTGAGGYFGWTGLAAMQPEQRLREVGVTTRGRVVSIERTNTRLNGRYLWQVRYEYRDASGRAHEGVSGYLERIDAQSFRVGEEAFVRYDPQQPSASVWVGREDRASG
jgi:hypothetical protein